MRWTNPAQLTADYARFASAIDRRPEALEAITLQEQQIASNIARQPYSRDTTVQDIAVGGLVIKSREQRSRDCLVRVRILPRGEGTARPNSTCQIQQRPLRSNSE